LCSPAPRSADAESLAPTPTSGRITRSASSGKSSVSPNTAINASAAILPYWLASTTQPPAMAAKVATTANVSAIPASIGNPFRKNGRSARANTNGSTGRMHGLMMPRNAAPSPGVANLTGTAYESRRYVVTGITPRHTQM
jgi:hypothetical protein